MLRVHFWTLMLCVLAGGCSPYVSGYHYVPRPAVAEIPPKAPAMTPPVSAFVSVIGIRNADDKEHLPTSIHVRLRLDNNGPEKLEFDPQSLDLTNGTLLRFPPPKVRMAGPMTLAPTESVILDAYFPFPTGCSYNSIDLESLEVRWRSKVGEHPAQQIVHFRRVYWSYYDPYWGYPPRFWAGGVVVVHRRR